MIKTIIVFPDGMELSSGADSVNAIQNFSLMECVNSGDELTIGSVCCNSIEVKVFTPSGEFSVEAGTEVTVYRQDDTERHKVGVFTLDKPSRVTANTMKIVGYDNVSKLDKDLTEWLADLDEWPANPGELASWICYKCGVGDAVNASFPNASYEISKFTKSSVTGRQLMKWLAEICGCFCRANADGKIEFAWYEDNGVEISATGDNYYFQNGLSYDDYVTDPIEAVQIRLADSENGVPWPVADEGTNSYIITGNPMMPSSITDTILEEVLLEIKQRLEEVSYTPCKVSLPARTDIHAGDIVHITDKNGKRITCYVMTKTQDGLKDTLECVGSKRRDSTHAMNNKTQAEKDAAMEDYADSAAQKAVSAQTADEVLRRLTNDYQIQGIWQYEGKWYLNMAAINVLNLIADIITAGKLQGATGNAYFDLDSGQFSVLDFDTNTEMNMSGGHLMGFCDNKQVVSLYPTSATSGRLALGKCFIEGTGNRLYICTQGATTELDPRYATWKELTYLDENGVAQTITVLAGAQI